MQVQTTAYEETHRQIHDLAGRVIGKALNKMLASESEVTDEWIGLALRWLALPKVSARKDPGPV